MAVPVHFAARDSKGVITHLGGVGPQSTSWQLTAAEVIRAIDDGEWLFLTQGPQDKVARVSVWRNTHVPEPHLFSMPDGTTINNLDHLPRLVSPIGGAWPTSPMNFVSVVRGGTLQVKRARLHLANDHTLTERRVLRSISVQGIVGAVPLIDMTGIDRSRNRMGLDIKLPFPARYYVNVLGDNGAITNLTQVYGDPLPVTDNWFTWSPGPTFFDHGGPQRISEVRLLCSLPRWAWEQPAFTLEVGYISLNPYALELLHTIPVISQMIRFDNLGHVIQPPPPADPDVEVPNCVGDTVTNAINKLQGQGLRFESYPADFLDGVVHVDWLVTTQSPAAGTRLGRGRPVSLFSRPQQTNQNVNGIKTVRVHNQYQQHRSLQVWNRDITAGTWTDEGAASYGGQPVSVDLVDRHAHALFYADYALNSCRPDPNFPPDLCLYKGPDGPVLGDDSGPTVDVFVS